MKKIVGSNNFSAQFIKIISRYKKIGYNNECIAKDCMLDGQPNHGWQLCFPLQLHVIGSGFRLYDSSDLKTYLMMRWLGPDALAVVRPSGVLLLDFFIDKLGIFHANQTSMCLDPHQN